jgi:hypothetical protein
MNNFQYKDCTSSVTFMPYIGVYFVKEYMIANYVGESLAALIPAGLSLAQGLGQTPGCYNETDPLTNTTNLVAAPIIPTYSVRVYFLLMLCLVCVSGVSFSLIHFLPIAVRERKITPSPPSEMSELSLNSNGIKTPQPLIERLIDRLLRLIRKFSDKTFRGNCIMLAIVFFESFFCYGILPGLVSYSTLPYGKFEFVFVLLIC